ncbi:hypothetical protein JG688_00017411 [Phytophthora aleatoria]|uniref:Uncharacterized protein n=1 Tax=Phytophthora aleatoria TaxID=2496075 RepID=A0A8J5ISM3_9STRA|nr:hypothetical protein JG688_00017411 [Phytophthora aleatoria]
MRVLLGEDEETAILEEAFALIDACDGFTSEGDSSSDSTALGRHDQVDESGLLRGKPSRSKKVYKSAAKKKRIRRPETSSTAFQRRKKAELVALRAEVTMLETRLGSLQQRCQNMWNQCLNRKRREADTRSGQSDQQAIEFNWCEEAVKQYRHRLAAELCNRKLKEVFENQTRMSCDLRAILYQRDALTGMDVVFAGVAQYQVSEQTTDTKLPTQLNMLDVPGRLVTLPQSDRNEVAWPSS